MRSLPFVLLGFCTVAAAIIPELLSARLAAARRSSSAS
jgi:hypothetical protein